MNGPGPSHVQPMPLRPRRHPARRGVRPGTDVLQRRLGRNVRWKRRASRRRDAEERNAQFLRRPAFVALFQMLGIGWFVAIAILLGVLGGLWLDNKLGTRPIFLILGIVLGLAAAGYGVYAVFKPFFSNNQGKGE